jgi:hypothetical protein
MATTIPMHLLGTTKPDLKRNTKIAILAVVNGTENMFIAAH